MSSTAETTRSAIILAAGSGRRMAPLSKGRPKCLLEIGGQTILEHQIESLRAVGIEDILILVGYRAEAVREIAGTACRYLLNPRFAETNSLYSLWLAREQIEGPFVLINGDVLAHPQIYHRLLAARGSALAYDSTSGDDPEHMKIALAGGVLVEIRKDLPRERSAGESLGMLRFEPLGAAALFEAASRLIELGEEGAWAPAAVHAICSRVALRGVDVGDLPWIEMDFPQDVQRAREVIWPACASAAQPEP